MRLRSRVRAHFIICYTQRTLHTACARVLDIRTLYPSCGIRGAPNTLLLL